MTTVVEDRSQTRVDGLLQVLRDAETDFRRSYARVLDVVAELDAEKAGAVAGFGTTARLLAGVLNLSSSESRTRTEQAQLLAPRRSLTGEVLAPALPATAAELAAGAIGPAHLRMITATVRRIPPSTHPDMVAQAEQTLARAARRFDPAALARIGERLLAHLDPDGKEPVEQPETMRELRVRTGPDGVVSLAGKLDPEGGARVLEVLNSLNGRRPPVDGVPDMRSPARRNADALIEAMTGVLDEGELPTQGGQRPHLVLTMTLSDLIDGLGSAVLDTGGRLSAAGARRMACDACVVPMVLGSDSMPLDVGRQHRLATAALRDALIQRDKGCAFPSCDRPPRYCEAHHIREWLDWGETPSTTCASCVTITTPSCTAKDGTSDSTLAVTPSSSRRRRWTPPEHHCMTHSDSKFPNPRLPVGGGTLRGTEEMVEVLSSYREQPAPAGLAGVVACLWRSETSAGREQRVLPDGCMDLIWMNGAVHVAGPDTRAFLTTQAPGQVVSGLRFRPGAAPGVLGVPAVALRDRRVRLEDLWPGTTIPQRITEAPDPAVALAAAVASRATEPDLALGAVLTQLRAGSSVTATANALGWTDRTLHRRCRDAFGYGPSVLRRILRFRVALRLAGHGVPFAATAARAGYADQAHLTREVRALAGVPLGQLIRGQLTRDQPSRGQPPSGANRSTPRPSGSCTTA